MRYTIVWNVAYLKSYFSAISPWEMLSTHYSSMSFKTTDKVEQKRDLLLMQNVRKAFLKKGRDRMCERKQEREKRKLYA